MNRFSICEAYYAFGYDWQASSCFICSNPEINAIHGRLARVKFKPRPSLGGFDTLDPENDPEAIDAYMALLDRYGLREEFDRQREADSPFDVEECTAPAYWASYLINGDGSGIDDDDIAAADAMVEDMGCGSPVSCSDEADYGAPDYGSCGDILTYSFLRRKDC